MSKFEPQETGYLWTTGVNARKHHGKVGAIPTAYPLDLSQAWASCEGCALRDGKRRMRVRPAEKKLAREEPQCYFWYGRTTFIQPKMVQAYERGKPYSLASALASRLKSAKAVRMSQGGDPASCDPDVYNGMRDTVKVENLAWLDYTHFWASRGAWLRGKAMASCDIDKSQRHLSAPVRDRLIWSDAIRAVKSGWRATVHLTKLPHKGKAQGTYRGTRYTLCPAQRTKAGKDTVTCNDCRLCDGSKKAAPIIVFINH
jgi:hypothetical protein